MQRARLTCYNAIILDINIFYTTSDKETPVLIPDLNISITNTHHSCKRLSPFSPPPAQPSWVALSHLLSMSDQRHALACYEKQCLEKRQLTTKVASFAPGPSTRIRFCATAAEFLTSWSFVARSRTAMLIEETVYDAASWVMWGRLIAKAVGVGFDLG